MKELNSQLFQWFFVMNLWIYGNKVKTEANEIYPQKFFFRKYVIWIV